MKRLAFLVALLPGPLAADVLTPGGRTIECFCTDSQGARVQLGRQICLVVGGRAYMALCDMSLNVPIWRDTGRGCASSGLLERLQRLQPAGQPRGVDAPV